MKLFADLKILYHMALKPVRGKDHAARLESFYSGQATNYDDFRERLLHGRQELWHAIETPTDGTWIDLGGGTGSNLEYFGERLNQLKKSTSLTCLLRCYKLQISGLLPMAGPTWKPWKPMRHAFNHLQVLSTWLPFPTR